MNDPIAITPVLLVCCVALAGLTSALIAVITTEQRMERATARRLTQIERRLARIEARTITDVPTPPARRYPPPLARAERSRLAAIESSGVPVPMRRRPRFAAELARIGGAM
jgi:hypothetical protein